MDKLKDIKEGDRVRVTFEGVIRHFPINGMFIYLLGGRSSHSFRDSEINQPSFTIEKLPEPLKAGDRVKWEQTANKAAFDLEGEIITTYQGTAWVKTDTRTYIPYSVEISRLSKIS